MDPYDYRYLNIVGRSASQWVQEIAQKKKASLIVSLDKDLRTTPQDPPMFLINLTMRLMDGTVYIGKGVANNKKKAKQIASIDVLNKLGETEETLRKKAFEPDDEGKLRNPVVENYIPELQGLCSELGLETPKFEILQETRVGIVKMKGSIPGRGELVKQLICIDEGQQNEVQQKIAMKLLNILYSQQQEIVANVREWANLSKKNTSLLSEGYLNIIFGKTDFPKTPLPRHTVVVQDLNTAQGNETDEVQQESTSEPPQLEMEDNNLTQLEAYVQDWHLQASEEISTTPLAGQSGGDTLNSPDLDVNETSPAATVATEETHYDELLLFVKQKIENSVNCSLEIEVGPMHETEGVIHQAVILILTYENCTASFHGKGASVKEATNYAALMAINFLKDQGVY